MDLLRLRAGRLAVDLAPHAGGAVARFAIEGADGPVDLLRPTDIETLTNGRGNASSCYPLVPYSNRIADAEVLPTTRVDIPPRMDFSTPRKVSSVTLDNCFDGWDGRAVITWPSRRLRLELEASPVFSHTVIYIPEGRPYFCVEPVSHANNGFALHALGVEDVGYRLLANGDRLAGEVVFRVTME